MSFHYAAADSQPDPGTFVFMAAVEPLKRRKDLVQVLIIETDAIIFDGKAIALFLLLVANPDMGGPVGGHKL